MHMPLSRAAVTEEYSTLVPQSSGCPRRRLASEETLEWRSLPCLPFSSPYLSLLGEHDVEPWVKAFLSRGFLVEANRADVRVLLPKSYVTLTFV